jgi:hypothetical protein
MNHFFVIIILTLHSTSPCFSFFTYLLVLVTNTGKTTVVQGVLYCYPFHFFVRWSNELCVEMFQQVSYGSLFLLLKIEQVFKNGGDYSSGFPI